MCAAAPSERPARLPAGPLTLSQALAAGVPEPVLRGPGYQRVLRGVYVASDVTVTEAVRARAALLLAPAGAAVARQSAARLWGGVVPRTSDVQLSLLPGTRLRVAGVDARVRAGAETAERLGMRLTTPAQTFLDLAGPLGLVDLVVLGDSFVRRGAVTPDRLAEVSAAASGRAAALARRAASLVRDGVESAVESRLRLLLVLAGLPEPTVGHVVRDESGAGALRLDLAYPELRIAIEYDSRAHPESPSPWVRDVDRREWLDEQGWRLVVVQSGEVHGRPERVLHRVLTVLRARGHPAAVSSREWRRHFLRP